METVPFKNMLELCLSRRWQRDGVVRFHFGQAIAGVLGVLKQQITGAAAAWVGPVPGEPGPSLQPGSNLSLLKCGEANIIAPEMGKRDIKTNTKENRMNITELKRKKISISSLIIIN